MSLTRLLNRCLGRSHSGFSEDSLDPDLCGMKTNRVNIFLAVYIPDLNISKHVKLTFLHHSLRGPCRLRLPRNPVELALGGAPSRRTGGAGSSGQELRACSRPARRAWQRLPGRSRCAIRRSLRAGRGKLWPCCLLLELEALPFP